MMFRPEDQLNDEEYMEAARERWRNRMAIDPEALRLDEEYGPLPLIYKQHRIYDDIVILDAWRRYNQEFIDVHPSPPQPPPPP